MKIAILGAGSVGATLGKRFIEAGHEVYFGVRSPESENNRQLVSQMGSNTKMGTVKQACQDTDIIVLATPWSATESAIKEVSDINGKIIIDCTNPLKYDENGLALEMGFNTSGGELVAQWAKGAKVVKTFNQTGYANMLEPHYGQERTVMFVCGDDPSSVETVRQLADSIGFEAIMAGNLAVSRLLEPFAMLWIHLAMKTDFKRDFAFVLKRR